MLFVSSKCVDINITNKRKQINSDLLTNKEFKGFDGSDYKITIKLFYATWANKYSYINATQFLSLYILT